MWDLVDYVDEQYLVTIVNNVLYFIHLPGAIDDCNSSEQDSVGLLDKAVSKMKKSDAKICRIQGMSFAFLIFNRHFVAVIRNHSKLIGKVVGIKGIPDIAVGKYGVASVRFVNWLEKKPALEKAIGIRSLWG